MEAQAHRDHTRQLAEDLGWLEEHCRKNPELAEHTAHLRLAGALSRNVIGPAVDGQSARPLHLAVVGGAGTGKSTVINFLAGAVVADANPQAGFTRHPTAYLPASLVGTWPSYLGFLGPLQRLGEDQPANLDEDVYQVKRYESVEGHPLSDFVLWDCPDMTTWASQKYVTRLLEVIALADVVVFVASDERYNDEVPTQFLHLLMKTGKAVICCLTKMREADAPTLIEHFRQEVLGRLPTPLGAIPPIPVVALPHLPSDVRASPGGTAASSVRVPLINQVLALCPDIAAARMRTLQNSIAYLEAAGDGLLTVARRDLTEFDTWRGLVQTGKRQFEERYRQEYLTGEAFRRFDKTREQVMAMLELPGPGKLISTLLSFLRMPYQYLRTAVAKTLTRPAAGSPSELNVCTAAVQAWLDSLQAEVLKRSASHPVWKQMTHGFDAGVKTKVYDLFMQKFREFELKEARDLDQAARAVPEALIRNPLLLQSARVLTVLLDAAVIGGILWATWVPSWYHVLLIPVAIGLTRHAVEVVVGLSIDAGRNRIRTEREALLQEHLTGPLETWLADWPSTGGSNLEKLQLVLRRVPELIRSLTTLLKS